MVVRRHREVAVRIPVLRAAVVRRREFRAAVVRRLRVVVVRIPVLRVAVVRRREFRAMVVRRHRETGLQSQKLPWRDHRQPCGVVGSRWA